MLRWYFAVTVLNKAEKETAWFLSRKKSASLSQRWRSEVGPHDIRHFLQHGEGSGHLLPFNILLYMNLMVGSAELFISDSFLI